VFSGVGGFDLGLEHAGYEVLGCIESDSVARASLAANRPAWPLLEPSDVNLAARSLKPADLSLGRGDLDLLVGAPPCQPYSKAAMWESGSWVGYADSRAKPLDGFLGLVATFLPSVVMMENVQGFLTGSNSVLGIIQDFFHSIAIESGEKYHIEWKVLDAAGYGVPQHRRRAILIASREDAISLPETTVTNPVRAWDALFDVDPDPAPPPASGRWAELLPSIPEGGNYLFHTSRGGGLPLFGYRTRYWSFLLKLAKNLPSWTIPAQPGPSVGPFHWDSRPLAANELLRLQSFPADWCVEGSRRDQVRQIGNATPPLLGEVLGRTIRTTLEGVKWPSPPVLTIERQAVVPRARARTRVPDKYLDLVGNHPAHGGSGLGPRPRGA
jgi:DNA (cytosine-5)-methyltransferase 1